MPPRAGPSSRQTPAILAPPPVLFFGCLLLGWALGRVRPFEPFALSLAARLAAGSVCLVLAVALGGSALRVMHRGKTPAEPWKPATRIVTGGPFRWSRNPIYIAVVLSFAGIAVMTASGWLMLLTPVLFVLLDRGVTRAEERYLSERFGEDYLSYAHRVRRWL